MGFEDFKGAPKTPDQLSPEEQKVANLLEQLSGEKNEMAIKILAAGGGTEEFSMEGIGFRLLRNPGEDIEKAQLQLENLNSANSSVSNFDSWKGNLEGLAKDLVSNGMTENQLSNYVEMVQDTAFRLEKNKDGQWIIDGEKTVKEFIESK